MNDESVLSCSNVSMSYKDGKHTIDILKDINFDIKKGEKVAILGLSGSGKTTLLNILGGLDRPTSGEVHLCGNRFDTCSANKRALMRNKHLGFVYQLHHLLPEFTALENVMMPFMIRNDMSVRDIKEISISILKDVGLESRLYSKPATLSGGERQRVAIARALVVSPSCVLADEPTGNLDKKRADDVFNLMSGLSEKKQVSFVIVTHDEALARKMNKIYRINDGLLNLESL